MKTTRKTQRRWLVALGIGLATTTSSCSMGLALSGVSSVREIYKPQTRAEVRAAFGEPDETGTCPDGRLVERRWIRQQVPGPCTNPKDPGCGQYLFYQLYTFGLVDVFVLPSVAIESERAKLHYAFVYGEGDRVLYRYDLRAAPAERYEGARNWMALRLLMGLRQGECPAWGTCLRTYVEEARQRATCVGYTLTPRDEELLQRLQALAADLEIGRLSPKNALADIQPCLWGLGFPNDCVPPASGRSDPIPAGAPEVPVTPHPAQDPELPAQPSASDVADPRRE